MPWPRLRRPARPLIAALVLLAACSRPDPTIGYTCEASGERFQYRDGVRVAAIGDQLVRFQLQTSGTGFKLSADPPLPEMADPAIVRDAARSSPAESVYWLDQTDPASRQRTVRSLVLNTVSGDVRVFHHRWLPPAGWRDSDQYLYLGNCRQTKARTQG